MTAVFALLGKNSGEGDAIDRIAQEVVRQIRGGDGEEIPISVGISARHAHVDDETLEILFGTGHTLTPYRELLSAGRFCRRGSHLRCWPPVARD